MVRVSIKPQIAPKSVAIIVAHPNDETLWAGGTILSHPSWRWFIICLCRESNNDRAQRFHKALEELKAEGIMGDLDDGPEQNPLDEKMLENEIMQLLPPAHFDIIITHNPMGKNAKNVRHNELSKATIKLWGSGRITANELWTFAYENDSAENYPKPIENASIYKTLTNRIWLRKQSILKETYSLQKKNPEALNALNAEAFWRFTDPEEAKRWIKKN